MFISIFIPENISRLSAPHETRNIIEKPRNREGGHLRYLAGIRYGGLFPAFANTIETLSYGVSYLDATASGMGRGAGNCAMELLLGFLKNPKYNLYSILTFLQDYMLPLKESGVVWGYDVQYLLTGQLNRHPREAMAFTAEKRTDYRNFYVGLLDND